MPGVVQQEWLNQNALRAYPFLENSQRRPSGDDGLLPDSYALPNAFVLDMVMSVPADTPAMNGVYLSRFTLSSGVATFVLSAVEDGEIVASVTVDLSKHENYRFYRFSGVGTYLDARGTIILGNPSAFGEFPDGVFSYTSEETEFEPRCVRPDVAGVRSLGVAYADTEYSTRGFQGDVKLVAGSNIRLTYDEYNNAIWINADSNSGYNETCKCGGGGGGGGGGDDGCSDIKTINGINVRDVVIQGGDGISVDTKDGVITITDTASKPCASCEELNFLNSKTNSLLSASVALSNYAELLNMRISQLETELSAEGIASVKNA